MYSVKLNGLFQAFDTAGETLLNGLVLAAEKFWSLVSSQSELSHLRGLVDHC